MRDWDDVVAFACTLPEVAMESYYGLPVPKLNGKPIVSQGREPGSFHLFSTREEKALLMETDPETFWETDHYRGWPGLLVRYGRARERVEMLITRSWWDRAKPAQRKAFGPRP